MSCGTDDLSKENLKKKFRPGNQSQGNGDEMSDEFRALLINNNVYFCLNYR